MLCPEKPPPDPGNAFAFSRELRAALKPDDRFILSFPRSGNTWIRFVLSACLMLRAGRDVPETTAGIAQIYEMATLAFPDIHQGLPTPAPAITGVPYRILKSHNIRELDGRTGVYLYRKPADALVSYARFAGRPVNSFAAKQVMSWASDTRQAIVLAGTEEGRLLPVSYEKLLTAPGGHLARLASHLGLVFDDAVIRRALELNRFERWKTYERTGGGKPLAPATGTFFSIGKSGDGEAFLSEHTLGWIREYADPEYNRLAAIEDRL